MGAVLSSVPVPATTWPLVKWGGVTPYSYKVAELKSSLTCPKLHQLRALSIPAWLSRHSPCLEKKNSSLQPSDSAQLLVTTPPLPTAHSPKHTPSVTHSVPYGPGQEGVEGIEPVVHVLVTACLQQDAPVLRAHRKRVGGLLGRVWGQHLAPGC